MPAKKRKAGGAADPGAVQSPGVGVGIGQPR